MWALNVIQSFLIEKRQRETTQREKERTHTWRKVYMNLKAEIRVRGP